MNHKEMTDERAKLLLELAQEYAECYCGGDNPSAGEVTVGEMIDDLETTL